MISRYRLTLAAGLALLVAGGAMAATQREPKAETKRLPSRERVLAAVDSLLRNPMPDRKRPEFPLIVTFADKSDQVDIVLGPPYFEFGDRKQLGQILLAYYIAGAVKFDLENPGAAHDPKAEAGPAIRAALVYYRAHRSAHPKDTHPLFEKFDALDKEGTLDQFIASQAPAAPADPR